MTFRLPSRIEQRVLMLPPTVRDGEIARTLLADVGIECVICDDADALARELNKGAAAVLAGAEGLVGEDLARLQEILGRQLPWSDLPLIVLTRPGGDAPGSIDALQRMGNVSLLERPVRVASLISAIRAALRARYRQYQIRAHLRERERAAEAAREAERRKDEFLAVLAHELRNPLAPIRNALTIMKIAGAETASAEGIPDMLERQVDHMVRLVDDLFEVSRISHGSIEVRRRPIDLADVLAHVVDARRKLMEASNQELIVSSLPSLGVHGDAVRLAQVFDNLLSNASKYSRPGGRIWLTARRDGSEAEVSVRDEGIGIPPRLLSRVFDMFMQADGPRDRAQGGLGIGLTLVRSLVERHDGRVEARSDGPGRGSEFVVRLPLGAGLAADASPAAPSWAAPDLSGRRILVVDDNRDSADSIGALIKLMGADAHVTYDGAEALAAIDAYRPDAVLLDIGLPGMDGYEVARRIRMRSELDGLTLVALTGWGQPQDRERTKAAGFQHHLVKPADASALRSLLAGGGMRVEVERP